MKHQYIVGVLAGWALWVVLIVIDYIYSASISDVPKPIRPITDLGVTVIGLAAWPLALGGWLAWGDNYLAITHNMPLNVAIGVVLYVTLGVIVARRWRLRGPMIRPPLESIE